mgnify:FL=1
MYNRQLDTFIQVADHGSFSKAAEVLFISPTAVLKQVNLLENELGFPLFVRTNRGISLTEAGKSLYKDAKYIIRYSRDSINRAKNAMKKNERVIRIGTSLMTPSKFIIDLWPKISDMCPDLKFQIVSFENTPENARDILRNLGENIDIVAGTYDDEFLKSRACSALKLSDEPIYCAVSINDPLAAKDVLDIDDLYGRTLMMIARGWNKYIDALRDELWENHPQIQLEDFAFFNVNVFNQCEQEGAALAIMRPLENIHPMLKNIPVRWECSVPFGILHSPTPSESVELLLDTASKVIEMDK